MQEIRRVHGAVDALLISADTASHGDALRGGRQAKAVQIFKVQSAHGAAGRFGVHRLLVLMVCLVRL